MSGNRLSQPLDFFIEPTAHTADPVAPKPSLIVCLPCRTRLGSELCCDIDPAHRVVDLHHDWRRDTAIAAFHPDPVPRWVGVLAALGIGVTGVGVGFVPLWPALAMGPIVIGAIALLSAGCAFVGCITAPLARRLSALVELAAPTLEPPRPNGPPIVGTLAGPTSEIAPLSNTVCLGWAVHVYFLMGAVATTALIDTRSSGFCLHTDDGNTVRVGAGPFRPLRSRTRSIEPANPRVRSYLQSLGLWDDNVPAALSNPGWSIDELVLLPGDEITLYAPLEPVADPSSGPAYRSGTWIHHSVGVPIITSDCEATRRKAYRG